MSEYEDRATDPEILSDEEMDYLNVAMTKGEAYAAQPADKNMIQVPFLAPGCFGSALMFDKGEVCHSCPFRAECEPVHKKNLAAMRKELALSEPAWRQIKEDQKAKRIEKCEVNGAFEAANPKVKAKRDLKRASEAERARNARAADSAAEGRKVCIGTTT